MRPTLFTLALAVIAVFLLLRQQLEPTLRQINNDLSVLANHFSPAAVIGIVLLLAIWARPPRTPPQPPSALGGTNARAL